MMVRKRKYTFRNRKPAAAKKLPVKPGRKFTKRAVTKALKKAIENSTALDMVSRDVMRNEVAQAQARAEIAFAKLKQDILIEPTVKGMIDFVNSSPTIPDGLLLAGAIQFGTEIKTTVLNFGMLRILASVLKEKLR